MCVQSTAKKELSTGKSPLDKCTTLFILYNLVIPLGKILLYYKQHDANEVIRINLNFLKVDMMS